MFLLGTVVRLAILTNETLQHICFQKIKKHFIVQKVSYGLNILLSIYYQSVTEYQMRSLFVCVEVLRPSQPSGVMSSAVSLPNHAFTGQA